MVMREVLIENSWPLAKPKLWVSGRSSLEKTSNSAQKSSEYSQDSSRVKKVMREVPTENLRPLAEPKLWISGRSSLGKTVYSARNKSGKI